MKRYLFYNSELGECVFALSASEDYAWETLANCFGCEYTASTFEFICIF